MSLGTSKIPNETAIGKPTAHGVCLLHYKCKTLSADRGHRLGPRKGLLL